MFLWIGGNDRPTDVTSWLNALYLLPVAASRHIPNTEDSCAAASLVPHQMHVVSGVVGAGPCEINASSLSGQFIRRVG
jgi:hypothetical protein